MAGLAGIIIMQSKLKSLLNIFDGVLGLSRLQVNRDLQTSVTAMAAKTSLKIKNLFMLSVRISSYECTREAWRARKMRKSCTRR